MQIKNLNNEDVEELKTKIKDLMISNPDITYKVLVDGMPSEKPVDNRTIPEMIEAETRKKLIELYISLYDCVVGEFGENELSREDIKEAIAILGGTDIVFDKEGLIKDYKMNKQDKVIKLNLKAL